MDMKQNAVIIAAGELGKTEYHYSESDYVIAADRGYLSAMALGVMPDCVIGDFDSLGEIPKHKNITVLPCEKDDTDTSFAVKKALCMGFKRIFILGGLGGRFDHSFANIQLLAYIAREGVAGFIVTEREIMTVIKDSSLTIHGKTGDTISVFSITEKSIGVCATGFRYPLENAVLESGSVIGTSNELSGSTAQITVAQGELFVCAQSDSANLLEKNRFADTGIYGKFNIYL